MNTEAKQLFESMHSKDETDKCKGFKALNYIKHSETKASRLSEVSPDITPYPFIVQILEKQPGSVCKSRGNNAFKTLEEAWIYIDSIV